MTPKANILEEIFSFLIMQVFLFHFEHNELDYPSSFQEIREFWRALSVCVESMPIANVCLNRLFLFKTIVET